MSREMTKSELVDRLKELVKKWRYQVEFRKVWMVPGDDSDAYKCCADALEKVIDEFRGI